jgi:hypothetical protein
MGKLPQGPFWKPEGNTEQKHVYARGKYSSNRTL